VYSDKSTDVRRNISPPSSGSEQAGNQQEAEGKQVAKTGCDYTGGRLLKASRTSFGRSDNTQASRVTSYCARSGAWRKLNQNITEAVPTQYILQGLRSQRNQTRITADAGNGPHVAPP
jgi:hypothetical protein